MKPSYNDLIAQEQEFAELLLSGFLDAEADLSFAYAFAKNAHGDQERDEGGPYIIHPLHAALILMQELGIRDIDMIRAALLHDVVEDTSVTLDEVRAEFGERVAGMVQDLTRERPDNETEAQKRVNKPVKIHWYMDHASRESTIIKCADILDNMRSWRYITSENKNAYKRHRWMQEADNLYIPLAEKTHPYFAHEMRELFEEYQRQEI